MKPTLAILRAYSPLTIGAAMLALANGIFLIPNPTKLAIRSASGSPVQLQCGPQTPARTLRIEYPEMPGQPATASLVRTLEFK